MPRARSTSKGTKSPSPRRAPRTKSPAAPRRGRSATPRRMSTRASFEASETAVLDKKTSGMKRFTVVLIFSAVLSQALSFLASGSKGAFTYLRTSSITIIGAQLLVWLQASGVLFGNAPTEHYYDLVGSITNVCAVVASVHFNGGWARLPLRQQILSTFAIVWATRLGFFLFTRVQAVGKDSRFDKMKTSPLAFAVAWVLQGLWVFITTLPVTSLNALGARSSFSALGLQGYVGMVMMGIGFLLEVVADFQKSQFKAVKGNKNRFINTGLWSISRHPNYYGEIMLWFGVYVVASGGMTAQLQKAITFLCPVFVCLLLVFVSGVNLLEKASDARWGSSQDYKEYKAVTPVLIPFIGRKGDAAF